MLRRKKRMVIAVSSRKKQGQAGSILSRNYSAAAGSILAFFFNPLCFPPQRAVFRQK
jgi:hypothetical protein